MQELLTDVYNFHNAYVLQGGTNEMDVGLKPLIEEFRKYILLSLIAYANYWSQLATMELTGVKSGSKYYLEAAAFQALFLWKEKKTYQIRIHPFHNNL